MVRLILSFAVLAITATLIHAAPKPSKSAWSPDDVVNAETATGFQISPDGRWVVWVKGTPDEEKGVRVGNLIRSSLTEDKDVDLTRGNQGARLPRWSPDGKHIAFLSTRPVPKPKDSARTKSVRKRSRAEEEEEPKTQIWLLDPFGGEPWHLTDYSRDIEYFAWAGSETIVFAAPEEKSEFEQRIKGKKDTTEVIEDDMHTPPARLFKVDIKTKKITRLTENLDRIGYLSASPDGKYVVTMNQRSLSYIYDNKVKPVVYLHNLVNGENRAIFKDPKLNIQQMRWTPDSKGIYAENSHSSKPDFSQAGVGELYYFDIEFDKHQKLDLQWERGLTTQFDNGDSEGFIPTKDGLVVLLADGARNRLVRYTRTAKGLSKPEPLTGGHVKNIFGYEVSLDGKTIVYTYSTASQPGQWYRAKIGNNEIVEPKKMTDLNKEWQDKIKAKTEVIRWKGANDDEVEGILYYPHEYKEGKKYPLVVMIHGGPASLDLDNWEESWAYPANHMCQRGAFVLKPNYHGSSNYGQKFVESIIGKYYDLEVPDIEKGVDHLIAKGFVDPEKLGVLGWSNGSILTIALTVHTTRYKAAAAGAGDVDWVSDWGNCEFGAAFDTFYFGKSLLEDPKMYLDKSPFFKLDKVRTPTIIFFGSNDRVVPTQQGWMHYRALQQHGKTDVRFLLFPDEEHSLKKLAHQKRKLEEELYWFDKHLFKTAKDPVRALKDDSPLAWALKRNDAKRSDGKFGEKVKDTLVPETVEYHGLNIGRFEVTAAQFGAFDKKYKVEPGKENYPAMGVEFDQAKAYCEWLSKLTGQKYRLPDEEDSEELYTGDGDGENTLDHWAGYTVNPDDARALQKKLADLGPGSPLLSEVGRYKGLGKEALVYDLGGNVAEWVVTKRGGQAYGGSADTPADGKKGTVKPTPGYIGFRVVRE